MDRIRPEPSNAIVDRWLAGQRRMLVTDLATTLDIDAGLREAMIPARHRDFVTDLADALDIEAGLAAIVPANASASGHSSVPKDELRRRSLTFVELREMIAFTAPAARLALRVPIRALARALDLALDLDLAHDLALDLDLARALAGDRDRALDLDLALDRAHDLALDLAHDLAHDLARDLACALARALALDRARDLARDLARAVALALALALALVRARKLTLAQDIDIEDVRAWDLNVLADVVSDFIGADLHDVDLTGVSLDGIRWSETTQWPDQWVDRIRRESVLIGGGMYVIRPGMTNVWIMANRGSATTSRRRSRSTWSGKLFAKDA